MKNDLTTRTFQMLAALACGASFASAQSDDLGLYALSIHDHLSHARISGSMIADELGQIEVEGDADSILVLLNPANGQDRSRFADLARDGHDPQPHVNINPFNQHGMMPEGDALNVVPLPPATITGLALLTGLTGVRLLRKIRH